MQFGGQRQGEVTPPYGMSCDYGVCGKTFGRMYRVGRDAPSRRSTENLHDNKSKLTD